MVECSAEPSVLAGFADTSYSVQTNLLGAFNCLELARRQSAFLVFLSTSRVYPVAPQLELEPRRDGDPFRAGRHAADGRRRAGRASPRTSR